MNVHEVYKLCSDCIEINISIGKKNTFSNNARREQTNNQKWKFPMTRIYQKTQEKGKMMA